MAGGVGEGAIPLTIGYAAFLHQPQGDLFAAGPAGGDAGQPDGDPVRRRSELVGKRYPHLTGEGRLQPGEQDDAAGAGRDAGGHM